MAIMTKGKGGALKASEVSNVPAGDIAATDVQAAINELDTEKITNATHTGDVTGSQALTITDKAVIYAKIQDVAATDKLLGRSSAGAGVIEEITLTAAGRALLDDLTAAAQRVTLSAAQSGANADINSLAPVGGTLDLTGNLELETTTASTEGVILKGVAPFIHDFHHPTGDTVVPAGYNIFLGRNAGNFTMGSTATLVHHGSYNVGIGGVTLASLTTGNQNAAFGAYSLNGLTTGSYNLGIGLNCLQHLIDGDYNAAIGRTALYNITTGGSNVAIGGQAGRSISGGADLTEADSSVFIGRNAAALADSQINQIVIGYTAIGKGSNTVTLGNDSITDTHLKGSVNMSQGGQTVKKTTVNAATYSTLVTDYILHVTYTATGACTITIPTTQITDGRKFIVKDASGNAGTNSITIATQGSETIDGAATLTVSTNYGKLTLYSDGSNLFTI